MENLQYPIGKFSAPGGYSADLVKSFIEIIESFPQKLKAATENLTKQQLDTPYRPGGWTVRQVVHHCADSHMNSIIRLKLALTEEQPAVRAYAEAKWAELADSATLPIESSLQILEGVHTRWIALLKAMDENDYLKTFIHPVSGKAITLFVNTAIYAWHCEHHLAHVLLVSEAK